MLSLEITVNVAGPHQEAEALGNIDIVILRIGLEQVHAGAAVFCDKVCSPFVGSGLQVQACIVRAECGFDDIFADGCLDRVFQSA